MSTYAERRAARSRDAVADIHAAAEWAERRGLVLLIEAHVDELLTIDVQDLPDSSIDGRDNDALAIALDDPSLMIVTSGGHFWATPLTADPRFGAYTSVDRPWGALGVSRLSGGYYGLHVFGAARTRFLRGIEEHDERTELSLRFESGAEAAVVRTNLGFRVDGGVRQHRARTLEEILRRLDEAIMRVDSEHYDGRALADLLDVTGSGFAWGRVSINGRLWERLIAEVVADRGPARTSGPG